MTRERLAFRLIMGAWFVVGVAMQLGLQGKEMRPTRISLMAVSTLLSFATVMQIAHMPEEWKQAPVRWKKGR